MRETGKETENGGDHRGELKRQPLGTITGDFFQTDSIESRTSSAVIGAL